MNLTKLLILVLFVIVTFLITNIPYFHLEAYFGLPNSPLTDIASHASYYFAISFPIFLLLQNVRIPVFIVYLLLVIPALFEFSQALVPGRTVSALDMLGSYIGTAAGLSICFLLRYFYKRRYGVRS